MEDAKTGYPEAIDHRGTILSLLEPFSQFTKTCRDAQADFSALIDLVQVRRPSTTCADKSPSRSASEWVSSVHDRLNHLHGDLAMNFLPLRSVEGPSRSEISRQKVS